MIFHKISNNLLIIVYIMWKIISVLFLSILISLYIFNDVENIKYFFQLKVTICSFIFACIFYIFYEYTSLIKLIWNKYISPINTFIDKYGIYILLISFFVLLNYLTFSKHLNYHSSGFDLWIFDQVIYKYSNWIFPASSSIREIANIEWDHFHPILWAYALFYKVHASPLTLLFLQNFFFVLGGLWIYKISKLKLNIPIIGFSVVFLYLIFKWNINALLFDFHPLVVAVSLFPWLLYYSIQKKWLPYFLILIPILLSKENMSIYILFFWIYQFFIQKDRTIWIVSFLIWWIYFYLVMNYFLPAMWWWGKYWSYDAIWSNPKELLINTFLHPVTFLSVVFSSVIKGITYLHHLGSWLYIALFTPVMIFLIPSYAQKFLSSREEFWTLNFHYSIDIYWIIAIGIIFWFVWIKNKYPQKYISMYIFVWIFIFTNSFIVNIHRTPLLYNNYTLENKQVLDKIINELPKNISISTQNKIVPHFSHNDKVYIFPNLWDAEFILLNTKINSWWPLKKWETLQYYIDKLQRKENFIDIKLPFIKKSLEFDSKYELIKEKEGIFLFKIIKQKLLDDKINKK